MKSDEAEWYNPKFGQHKGFQSTELIIQYLTYWPFLRAIVLIFKMILKASKLNCLYEGIYSNQRRNQFLLSDPHDYFLPAV